jgi:hypothetical protein
MPRALGVALGVLAVTLGASASVAVPLTFEDVVRRADFIVEGTVSRVTSRTRPRHGRTLIETHVSIAVSRVHRGGPVPAVSFTLPGGRAGERAQVVVGTPTFHVNEEVIAFFHVRDGALALVGLGQGLYRVNRLRDGRAFAVRDLRDIAFHGGAAITDGERESIPLDLFRDRLRRALEDQH